MDPYDLVENFVRNAFSVQSIVHECEFRFNFNRASQCVVAVTQGALK